MSKSLRLSEKWYRRGLWLVALAFASFLIGLGGTLVGDLPRVEQSLSVDDFMGPAAPGLREAVEKSDEGQRLAQRDLEQAQLKLEAARQANRNAREAFSNWLATRHATQQPDQDAELIARTRQLDGLKAAEDDAQKAVQAARQRALDARQAEQAARLQLATLRDEAEQKWDVAARRQELRVFAYRLALTLPLLVVAGWLFARKRKSTWWPFVWGFIFFALFAFFFELVPYLPSYGGYVRYVVGVIVTVLVGRYAILGLNRYLERQKLAESQPEQARREVLDYDMALARLAKGACPGCERPVDLKNTEIDFCPHCGIGLHDHCGHCRTRKSAFSKYCHACGTPGRRMTDEAPPASTLPPAAVPAA